jgi:FKBP-type peptidyl-prolyl cis-trans isomerase FkpA
MKIVNVMFCLLIVLCSACSQSEKETLSGMKFQVIKAGDGTVPKADQVLVFNFRLKDSKDSVWSDTYVDGMPAAIMIRDTVGMKQEDGIMQMLRMVSAGDSIHVKFSMKEFFRDFVKRPIPPGVDSTLNLMYQFKIDSITTREEVMAMQSRLLEKKQKVQLDKDLAIIDKFLADKNIQALKADAGLRYIMVKSGTGENAKSGQTVKVDYSGYMLDGTYFDSSVKSVAQEKGLYNPGREPYSPYDVTIDQTQVIKGWHEALKLMNKGSKMIVYIPSPLGYGTQYRSEVIKPNSILVFELEVVDLN